MDVYIYNAALLCATCGPLARLEAAQRGKAPPDPDNEHSYDSDDYPKGPFSDGGGEADHPQHCDHCGVFLKNPLTSFGESYLCEKVAEFNATPPHRRKDVPVWSEWIAHYGYLGLRIETAA